jgi:hypothetical protein
VKVYVAGPINGQVDGNRVAFSARCDYLRQAGHTPVNPWDLPVEHEGPCMGDPVDHEGEHRYGCYMRKDLQALMECEAISLLPGWQNSRGARVEQAVAAILGLHLLRAEGE